jgi:hypothetical protein
VLSHAKHGFFVLAVAISAQCNATAPPLDHPIIGYWSWSDLGSSCIDQFHFRADGTWLGASGDERTKGEYQIEPEPSGRGLYIIAMKITWRNESADCAGKKLQVGTQATAYVRISAHNALMFCSDREERVCIGPYRRLPVSAH